MSDVMFTARMPRELIRLLDDEVRRLSAERPGAKITRSDVIRETLYRALRKPTP